MGFLIFYLNKNKFLDGLKNVYFLNKILQINIKIKKKFCFVLRNLH